MKTSIILLGTAFSLALLVHFIFELPLGYSFLLDRSPVGAPFRPQASPSI